LAEAEVIYQRLLDQLSTAVINGDIATVVALFDLPFRLGTLNGSFILTTEADVADHALALNRTLRQLGATDYIRLASGARFLDPGRIEGTHVTHMMRRAERVIAPFPSRMVIVERAGGWRVAQSVHALENHHLPFDIPRPAHVPDLTPPELAR
jgi:hypothetical protein